ncbi:transposable element Tcb1 transposase [Trichonephila clavipes]|nr:transposable element Tcb1 transposase [Trichonephila clavipes]
MLNSCVMHRHTGPAPGIMDLSTAIFQQDNERPDVARIVQRFYVNHQIELLPWPARSPDLSLIENMWSMVAQRLTQITPPAATPDQIWQRVEAAWSDLPQEHIQSLFESMPRTDEGEISDNGANTRKLFLQARSPIIDISHRFMEIHKRKIEKLKKSRRKMKKKVWFED